ncbi:MAG: ThiF family adenylyltransferase, partial [Cyanobacteria bacterium]|nr:ThiF family adenylyltransferase [Cyanobacteriota bacterium]
LGCPVGLYLAAAGVGSLGVCDDDVIELHNLQRQIAHQTDGIGTSKTQSLIQAMAGINPLVHYNAHPCRLTVENVESIISGYDLVIDGTDNFTTRFLLADACYFQKIPLLQGSVYQYSGQLGFFLPDEGPCFRCLFPAPPGQNALAPCGEAGVLGVVPGLVGTMMATEAIHFFTTPTSQYLQRVGRWFHVGTRPWSQRILTLTQDPACPLCGKNPVIHSLQEEKPVCSVSEISPEDLISWEGALKMIEDDSSGSLVVLDVRNPEEYQGFHLPQALNIPLMNLSEKSLLEKIPSQSLSSQSLLGSDSSQTQIIVYCQKGQRSQVALEKLKSFGYLRVKSVVGGISALDVQLKEAFK